MTTNMPSYPKRITSNRIGVGRAAHLHLLRAEILDLVQCDISPVRSPSPIAGSLFGPALCVGMYLVVSKYGCEQETLDSDPKPSISMQSAACPASDMHVISGGRGNTW